LNLKNKMSIVIAALLVVSLVGATQVFAQGSNGVLEHGRGPGGGRGLGGVALDAAAKALNMTTDELTAALKSGKTLPELADEAGVDIEEVRAAIQAARETELRERISQAVADGTISQAKADWLLEGLDQGFLFDGSGFGLGFGGPRGHGFGEGPLLQPSQSGNP
jgi:hypothetical protein